MPIGVPDFDVHHLAVGIFYLMTGRATIDYPTTTAAHPSYDVVVSLGHGAVVSDGDAGLFPFKVRWDLWENLVVPTWSDPGLHLKAKGLTVSGGGGGIVGKNRNNLTEFGVGGAGGLLAAIRARLGVVAGRITPGDGMPVTWNGDELTLTGSSSTPTGGYLPLHPPSPTVPTGTVPGGTVIPGGTSGLSTYSVFDED